MTSSGMHEEKRASGAIVAELKGISHDVFNLMTVMYGLQEALQGITAEDEAFSRALSDFNQVVTKMQQIGDRMLKLYREEGGIPSKAAKEDVAGKQ
jgi:signal transduction histidine kinase